MTANEIYCLIIGIFFTTTVGVYWVFRQHLAGRLINPKPSRTADEQYFIFAWMYHNLRDLPVSHPEVPLDCVTAAINVMGGFFKSLPATIEVPVVTHSEKGIQLKWAGTNDWIRMDITGLHFANLTYGSHAGHGVYSSRSIDISDTLGVVRAFKEIGLE